MIDKRPAVIACCRGVADVINPVNFTRAHALLVPVHGGGHNVAGNATCDGGFVIDLSGMRSVRVDPVHRNARAEPGVTWGEIDRETQAFGWLRREVRFKRRAWPALRSAAIGAIWHVATGWCRII